MPIQIQIQKALLALKFRCEKGSMAKAIYKIEQEEYKKKVNNGTVATSPLRGVSKCV